MMRSAVEERGPVLCSTWQLWGKAVETPTRPEIEDLALEVWGLRAQWVYGQRLL